MIQANPDREFARLQKTILDMPISNPDDKKERFPKELSRRLFPSAPDMKIREKLETSIITHCEVELPRNPPAERSKSPPRRAPIEKSPPRASTISERVPAAAPASKPSSQEREAPSATVEDEEDLTTAPRPIERERKPYSVQPGVGKLYEDTATNAIPKTETSKSTSSTSTVRQEPPYSRAAPPTTGATGHSVHAHHGSISSKPGRRRSSSVGINGPSDYRHSEPDLNLYEPSYTTLGSAAGAAQSGNPYKTTLATTTGDAFDDDRVLYRDYDRDDTRDYDVLRERERERERERRYHDHLGSGSSRTTWSDEDYYRGLLGGQGGGTIGGHEYKYR